MKKNKFLKWAKNKDLTGKVRKGKIKIVKTG